MRTRLFSTVFVILLVCAAPAAAQEPRPSPSPFDAFEVNLLITTWKARLDNFAIELQSAPASHGYIVAYSARYKQPGWPLYRARAARNYLIESRGLDPGRVSVFAGDERAEPGFELWVLRPGETLPVKPLDYALALAGERSPIKFDVLYVFDERLGVEDFEDLSGDGTFAAREAADRFGTLFNYLKADPSLRAVFIGYALRRHPRGTDRRLAAREKQTLLSAFPVAPARVVARGGGSRRYPSVEVWLVPPGAPLPRPTPETRPVRRRRRR